MENTIVKDSILDIKLEGYGVNINDFKADQELTVEITLREYRELVKDCATASRRIDEANADKYERSLENKQLRDEVDALRAENYELRKALGAVPSAEEGVRYVGNR